MNLGKAREYFSAYYEGSLDRGLREGFDRVLREDAQVQAEYRAFESTMKQLAGLGALEVDCPDDLHEKVMARIDRHVWEKNQGTKSGPFNWWKVLLPAAAALAIITLAVVPWRTPDQVNIGSVIPTKPGQARLDVRAGDQSIVLNYPGVDQREVVIRDAAGTVLESIRLRGQGIRDKVLRNAAPEAILLSIDESDLGTSWIAIPGSSSTIKSKGAGTIKDLAVEIATGCRIPVVLQLPTTDTELEWKLDTSDAVGTVTRAIEPLGLKVELRGDNSDVRTLWILKN